MGKRVVRRALAFAVLAALAVVAPMAGAAVAGEAGGSGGEVVATLKIDAPAVSVKKAGADEFKPAKDGQKLKQGDTVQTDATGKAEIDYSDDAYTRLDVNTTFTIAKLTEEEGERQIEGSLENGRTWNRTAAVTESGSFEQSGAGATAAVVGTAFPVDCTSGTHCVFTGVEGTFILTGADGEERTVTPFDQCDSTSGDLCDEVKELTADEIAAITWIQENLLRDLVERGVGNGPIIPPTPPGPAGTLIVENGQVIEFVEVPTSLPPSTPPDEEPPPDPPTVDGVTVTDIDGSNTPTQVSEGDQSGVSSEDERTSSFVIRVTNPDGGTYFLVFTELPDGSFGVLYAGSVGTGNEVQEDVEYSSDTVFVFDPVEIEPVCSPTPTQFEDCFTTGSTGPYPSPVVDNGDGTVSWFGSFTIKAVDESTGLASVETPIELEVVDDICATGTEPERLLPESVTNCPSEDL